MEGKPERLRLRSFIKGCDGIHNASSALNVRPSTLTKLLNGKSVSPATREKLIPIMGVSTSELKVSLQSRLQEMANDNTGVLRVSFRLGVKPSSVRKILDGKPVTPSVTQKVQSALRKGIESREQNMQNPSMVRRFHKINNLYQEKGTLEAVGKEIGVTRERVRQILVKGSKLGFFDYKPFDYPPIPREKILEDYKCLLNFKSVMRANSVSEQYFHRLLVSYRITGQELALARIKGHKQRCVEKYYHLAKELGHHPTKAELQRGSLGYYLSTRISKLWGSFNIFRAELNIPSPQQEITFHGVKPSEFREDQQQLERITQCLKNSDPMALSRLAISLVLKTQRDRNTV